MPPAEGQVSLISTKTNQFTASTRKDKLAAECNLSKLIYLNASLTIASACGSSQPHQSIQCERMMAVGLPASVFKTTMLLSKCLSNSSMWDAIRIVTGCRG